MKKEGDHGTGLSCPLVRRREYLHHLLGSYFISGRKEYWKSPEIEYNIHILRFIADQGLNPIPAPKEELSQSFRVPSEMAVK